MKANEYFYALTDDDAPPDDHGESRDLSPDELDALLADYERSTSAHRPLVTPEEITDDDPDPELDQFLSEPEPDYDWLIPDIIERGDRMILTGAEGAGKSTLLRQIGVQAASGIHPFTLAPQDPINVLLIDLENTRRQTRRRLKPLRAAAGADYPSKYLRVIVRPAGLNLTEPTDMAWLGHRIEINEPDLVIIGPIYKMHAGDPVEEAPARTVIACLDHMRERYGVALMMEAHSPHAAAGGTRPMRPYGASIWMRWPEFGLHITEAGQLKHWRGDRDERQWPTALRRGGEWPWSPVTGGVEMTFASVLATVAEHGSPLSYAEIAKRLDCSKAWVGKTIKANERQWEAFIGTLEADAA